MRARTDAADEKAGVLRQRALHAASDRGRASHRSVDGAARAARRAGRDCQGGRDARARPGGTPRSSHPRAPLSGAADPRVSRLRSQRALRRAGRFQRLAAGTLSRACSRSSSRKAATTGIVSCAAASRSFDRIWVHPTAALRRVFTHATPTARLASDHLPVVADIVAE